MADYVKFLLATWECLTLMPPMGVIPCEYPDKLLPLQKLEGLFYQMLKTT